MTALAAFWQGLTRPSLPALLGALLVAGSLVGLCAVRLDASLVASGQMLTSPGDDYAAVSAQALRLASEPPARRVLILGSSATREALDFPEVMQARLSGRSAGAHLDVLVAADLFLPEAAALLDQLPEGSSGQVVLEVSARNLGLPAERLAELVRRSRLPLYSDSFDRLGELAHQRPPYRSGNYFLDHHRFFLARPQALLRLGQPPQRPAFHQADHLPPPSDADWQRWTTRLESWLDRLPRGLETNLAAYRLVVQQLQARGFEVALLQAPRNPWVLEKAQARHPQELALYQQTLQQLGQELGVPVWDLAGEAGLRTEQFRDYAHLVDPGARSRFSQALLRHLGRGA